MSLASDSSETIEFEVIIKLGMLTASDMGMHHIILSILTLTFTRLTTTTTGIMTHHTHTRTHRVTHTDLVHSVFTENAKTFTPTQVSHQPRWVYISEHLQISCYTGVFFQPPTNFSHSVRQSFTITQTLALDHAKQTFDIVIA